MQVKEELAPPFQSSTPSSVCNIRLNSSRYQVEGVSTQRNCKSRFRFQSSQSQEGSENRDQEVFKMKSSIITYIDFVVIGSKGSMKNVLVIVKKMTMFYLFPKVKKKINKHLVKERSTDLIILSKIKIKKIFKLQDLKLRRENLISLLILITRIT